jgi:hypothetical protein
MSRFITLVFIVLCSNSWSSFASSPVFAPIRIAFYKDSISLPISAGQPILFSSKDLSQAAIQTFYDRALCQPYQSLIATLVQYKNDQHLDDWFFYQLIRKTAQQICPKQDNFNTYTLYKWYLLSQSGYDARLVLCDTDLLLYVHTDEHVYDIPFFILNDKQYVCLNYHDFGSKIDFEQLHPYAVNIPISQAQKPFSYSVHQLPEFTEEAYTDKLLHFWYKDKEYTFKLRVNTEIRNIFANYPVVDFDEYFNIPLSQGTYNSLFPALRKAIQSMNQQDGVDYLMRFTRYAFAYQNDQITFGKEKRFSPEQTLLYNTSDCDDRAALFFSLVKELYQLPMIVLLYPKHITVAVQFEAATGQAILYKNKKYYICEPTPQATDLPIGTIDRKLKHAPFEIAYEYNPTKTLLTH